MRPSLVKLTKLFRKISVFEALLGFLLFFTLVFIMLSTRSKEDWIKAEVLIYFPALRQGQYLLAPFWLGESIKVNDREFDSRGKPVVEVLAVKAYELANLQPQEPATKDFYLTLKLRVSRDARTAKLKFKNQALEIGGPIELHLANTYVPGLVTSIEGMEKEEVKEVVVFGVWMNTFPWLAEKISIGGKMEDGRGNVIAEVLEKKIELAEKTVETDWGGLVASRDPLKRDVFLKVKLKVKEKSGNLYFLYDKKVKVGENLFIQTPEIDIKWLGVKEIFDSAGKKLN